MFTATTSRSGVRPGAVLTTLALLLGGVIALAGSGNLGQVVGAIEHFGTTPPQPTLGNTAHVETSWEAPRGTDLTRATSRLSYSIGVVPYIGGAYVSPQPQEDKPYRPGDSIDLTVVTHAPAGTITHCAIFIGPGTNPVMSAQSPVAVGYEQVTVAHCHFPLKTK